MTVGPLIPSRILAWGPGHDNVNELALDVLPPEIQSELTPEMETNIVDWSHKPDDFTVWEDLGYIIIDPNDLTYLHSHGMNHPYSLHSAKGQAVNFILLVRAFRSNDPDRIAYWMACLMHTFADEAACNHDPLIHIMTYAFRGGYDMEMGAGVGLDFANVATTPEGEAIIQALLADFTPTLITGTTDEILVSVMMTGVEGNAFMTQRGRRIARSYAADASEADMQDGRTALAELGVYGIEKSVDAIYTAWDMAEEVEDPDVTTAVEDEYGTQKAAFLSGRPIELDSIYEGLLPGAPAGQPAVGIVIEPSQSMNSCYLCFSAKYIASAIMHTLEDNGVPYRALDLRDMETEALPSPEELPAVIVCSGSLSPSWAQNRLKDYGDAGGRIILIGGEHRNVLGDLSTDLIVADDQYLPVSKAYGQNNLDRIDRIRILFAGPLETALGAEGYAFTHNPDTAAGWQKPGCFYSISGADPDILILARLTLDATTLLIAGAQLDAQAKAKYVFLPEYLLSPYLLSDQVAIQDPSVPELDDVGDKILMTVLGISVPELCDTGSSSGRSSGCLPGRAGTGGLVWLLILLLAAQSGPRRCPRHAARARRGGRSLPSLPVALTRTT